MTTFTTEDRLHAGETPLTEEQIEEVYQNTEVFDYISKQDCILFARAIERAHGIGE
jgi:hypothetical protein